MAASWLIRTLLTAAFVVAGALGLSRCFARAEHTTRIGRFNDTTHVLMTVEMLVMVWALPVPAWSLRVAAFAAASGWFVVQATGVPLSAHALSFHAGGTAGVDSTTRDGLHRLGCLHHAALMLTTVWMLGGGPMNAMTAVRRPAVLIAAYCLIATPICVLVAIRGWHRGGTARTAVAEPVMTAAMAAMALLH